VYAAFIGIAIPVYYCCRSCSGVCGSSRTLLFTFCDYMLVCFIDVTIPLSNWAEVVQCMLAVSDILRRTADETPKCGGVIARSDWAQACGRLQELVQLAETHRKKLDDAIATAKTNRSLTTELVCSRVNFEVGHTTRAVLDAICKVSSTRPFLGIQSLRLKLADPKLLSVQAFPCAGSFSLTVSHCCPQ
jgi:hypothetical protein